ncbi:MAG: beta-1,6-N-acetylglucosaminyltransferase [Porphyromonadaceae bacterium]|nr:beta-1,6-N-acetylglucosaminyltransferase [Porphyromonadaceae bacterium]
MAHTDKYLLQVLVGMLDDERNDIYIHIDKKWRDFTPNWLSVSKSNLYILDKRIDARWGHPNLIEVEYALFEAAYKRSYYSYYHLLSGTDLPIKTQDYIHRFFDSNQGREFVSYWDPYQRNGDAELKISRYYLFMKYEKMAWRIPSILIAKCREFLARTLPRRKFEYQYKKGSQWLSLTHSSINMLLEHRAFVEKRAKYTRSGDEIFLQTLLWEFCNSNLYKHNGSYDRAAMREIRWSPNANSPDTYTMKDKDFLMASDMLFARKFSSTIDREIIDFIQKEFSK